MRRPISEVIPAIILMGAVSFTVPSFGQNSDFNLNVHANSHATAKDIGLPAYPGATPFRLMVILGVTTGLRRSELFALKWRDADFSNLQLDVQRSIYLGRIGKCKTEASRKPVPLDERVAADLWLWKEASKYREADDWIFASPHTNGSRPFWPDAVLQNVIRPAALKAGIRKVIGWHTFRRTYSTLLIANDENVKVVQELMRHANSRSTLEIYSQARMEEKRRAQQRVVQAIFPDEVDVQAPMIQGALVTGYLERRSTG